MKRVLAIFLICFGTFVFAEEDPPIFEEDDGQALKTLCIPFAAEEPVFEEDDEEANRLCDEENCDHKSRSDWLPALNTSTTTFTNHHATYVDWKRYKAYFGIEKLLIRFPQKPAISQSPTLLTAYAYDNAVLYSMNGYFPPVGSVDPLAWFDDVLSSVDYASLTLISHAVFQAYNGDWIMDYVAHDQFHQLIIKARAIVTPFNAYTMQCSKPIGMRDYFDYFLDNFVIQRDYL